MLIYELIAFLKNKIRGELIREKELNVEKHIETNSRCPIGVGMATVFCRCCVTPVKFSFTGDQL
jgi:hypothetical protein